MGNKYLKNRCEWVNNKNDLYIKYHEEEWGVPVHNDTKIFTGIFLTDIKTIYCYNLFGGWKSKNIYFICTSRINFFGELKNDGR